MLQMQAQQGISHVIATPHFYPRYDKPESFLRRRSVAEDRLRAEMEKYPHLPQISVGAEVYFFHGISESEYLPQLAVQGHRCIMVEMPGSRWTDSVYQEFAQIRSRWGLVPVIAHIDRYITPWNARRILQKLDVAPVMIQANARFFTDRKRSALAMRMMKQGYIHLLGSDCHNMEDRKPNLGEAVACIQKQLGDSMIDFLQDNSKHLQITPHGHEK